MIKKNEWILLEDKQVKEFYRKVTNVALLSDNDEILKEKAELFKALGDETRLKIIGMLAVRDSCMCEIVAGLDGANSTISYHLKLLERGAVVKSRKEGKFTVYQLNKAVLEIIGRVRNENV